MGLSDFVRAYLECALWSSSQCDEDGNMTGSFDNDYSVDDFTPEALKEAISDCEGFQESNAEDLARAGDDEQNGHDFWLTRNGHGAGFWDRGYEAGVAKRLTDASHAYGSCDLMAFGHGKVHIQ